MSYDIRNIKGRKDVREWRGAPKEKRSKGGLQVARVSPGCVGFAAKRDAVIQRYWQFSRSITGTRKEKILRLKFIEGVERVE